MPSCFDIRHMTRWQGKKKGKSWKINLQQWNILWQSQRTSLMALAVGLRHIKVNSRVLHGFCLVFTLKLKAKTIISLEACSLILPQTAVKCGVSSQRLAIFDSNVPCITYSNSKNIVELVKQNITCSISFYNTFFWCFKTSWYSRQSMSLFLQVLFSVLMCNLVTFLALDFHCSTLVSLELGRIFLER